MAGELPQIVCLASDIVSFWFPSKYMVDHCYAPRTVSARSQFLKSNSDLFCELSTHNARLTD